MMKIAVSLKSERGFGTVHLHAAVGVKVREGDCSVMLFFVLLCFVSSAGVCSQDHPLKSPSGE